MGGIKRLQHVLSLRVSAAAYAHLIRRATKDEVDVSRVVRRMLAYASVHMPEGWKPDHEEWL